VQPAPHTPRPTAAELFWASADMVGGLSVMFLPMLLLAVPGIILFVVLPALVLAVAALPLAVAAALVALPILLRRAVRRLSPPRPRWRMPRPASNRRPLPHH